MWRSRYSTGSARTRAATSSMNDSCAERVLQPPWRPQRSRPKGDATTCMSTRSLLTVPVPPHAPPTQPVTYEGAAFWPLSNADVGAGAGLRRASAGSLEAREHAGRDVPGVLVARPAAAARAPRLVVPRDDVAGRVERGALFEHECVAVVSPRHLVFAREKRRDRVYPRLRRAAPRRTTRCPRR